MTGPKHLWSGNWEEESSSQDELAERRVTPRAAEPSTPPTQPNRAEPATPATRSSQARRQPKAPARARRRRRAWIAAGTLAVVVVVGALALTTLGGSSKPRTAASTPVPSAPSLAATTPTTATPPVPSSPPVSWLGMELVTAQPGGATVETVRLGSEGDRAGLSPGDVILQINSRPVTGADGIATAIQGLHAGDRVVLQVSHGSSLSQIVVTLGASPTRYP